MCSILEVKLIMHYAFCCDDQLKLVLYYRYLNPFFALVCSLSPSQEFQSPFGMYSADALSLIQHFNEDNAYLYMEAEEILLSRSRDCKAEEVACDASTSLGLLGIGKENVATPSADKSQSQFGALCSPGSLLVYVHSLHAYI